jgi:hypothetical protein
MPKYVAYLFYERDSRKISLFIIDPDDLDVEMEEVSSYSISMSGCNVKVWSDRNQVYAIVE